MKQKESTAREMFEALDYEFVPFSNSDKVRYIHKYDDKIIEFSQEYNFVDCHDSDQYAVNVYADELQAVHKQMMELGWYKWL